MEEAERQLQKERTELDELQTPQSRVESKPVRGDGSDVGKNESQEERLFQVHQGCRMVSILQEALYRHEEAMTLFAKR